MGAGQFSARLRVRLREGVMLDGRIVFVGAAAAILSYQLILPPVVGLSDNGDFVKVIGRFDLHGKVYRPSEVIDTVYEFDPARRWVGGFYSTEILLTLPALALNSLLSKDGTFDLRLIGIVHGLLFLAALWLFAPLLANARRALRTCMYLLILLMYCDVMYVSGLNSFYMDEAAYLFLLLSAVLYLRVIRWHHRRDAILLLLCTLLLVTAKTQHAVLGFFVAALLFATRGALWPARRSVFAVGAASVLLASLLMLWKGAPRSYAYYSLYNATFTQILPHSKNVERALKGLGLDDSYRTLIGKNAYWPDSRMEEPAFRGEFEQRITVLKLAMFYGAHPGDTYEALRDSLDEAGRQRLFGNFDLAAGYAPFTESKAFAYWSNFKQRLFFHHGSRFLFAFAGVSAILSALLWVRRKDLSAAALAAGFMLIGMAFTELAISSLFDAMDIVRHHLIFFALFDMMTIATVYLAITANGGRAVKAVVKWWPFPRQARPHTIQEPASGIE
jgi:hypothetical protein